MVRHVIMWDFKDGFSDAENASNAQEIKTRLEALVGVVPGLVSLRVITSTLAPGSNRPILLDSVFESEAALAAYIVHPGHVKASAFVRSVTQGRSCVDYQE